MRLPEMLLMTSKKEIAGGFLGLRIALESGSPLGLQPASGQPENGLVFLFLPLAFLWNEPGLGS
jgi:hypothetical protein